MAEEGLITNRITVWKMKKHGDEACAEIETAHPGYLGSEGTFYVGTFKGIGCVYQQTFVDTYSKVVHAKLVSQENTDYSS